MPDVLEDDETDALAGEFVLGTLDADERTHANLLLDIDEEFRRKVRVWERRLGELHLMVEPVEPAPHLWERIKIKIGGFPAPAPPTPAPMQPAAPPPAEPAPAEVAAMSPAPAAQANSAPEPDPKEEELAVEHKSNGKSAAATTLQETLAALEAEFGNAARSAQQPPEQDPKSAPEIVVVEPDEAAAAEPLVKEPSEPDESKGPSEPPADPDVIARARAEERQDTKEALDKDVELPLTPEEPVLTPSRQADDDLRPALRRWRAVAVMVSIVLILLGVLLAAWRYAPDRLPMSLRATTLLRINVPPPPPAKPKAPPDSVFDE
jgi:anti-sigma-K factor RskA